METNTRTLIYQLGRQVTNLPRSLVARWITWIQIWDFEIKYVLGKKNSTADGLLRQYCDVTNIPLEQVEDVDD